ncbi:MAG: DUF4282 domain-containing protein [Saprospiraceae bacterium]|nr:DUF4282 domain-containing protein [Saprospiraceae bacterium]MCP5299679.1 DUF4282 domain-containing protein [Chromatiaceae bacterium]
MFERFVAEDVLIVFYIVCAVLIPIASWYFLIWVIRRYAVVMKIYDSTRSTLILAVFVWIVRRIKFFRDRLDEKLTWQTLSMGQKAKFLAMYCVIVVLAEVFLRLTFEYLIAYMHMHEWLRPVEG